ncbi:MAG: glucose-1-phosphate adenylyltransferase [Candidatus Aureabacteria bacterium]|nr:glucose-1-phosphate adenylyltransferase [Candidatus Auribacterota bacterium]
MTPFNRKTLVVILGGGQGNRLYPLTKMRSKPAVPLAGRYRLIDVPVSNCLHSGLERIFVLTQFNSASLNQHIARTYHFDSFSNGFVEILAAHQTVASNEWFQGTADAVRKVYSHIGHQEWEQILILSGDHLYRMDYVEFLQYHLEKKADISVCACAVNETGAGEFGLLKVDGTGKIYEFLEKPNAEQRKPFKVDTSHFGLPHDEAKKRPYLGSMGIYIFNRDIMERVLFENPSLYDFGKHVIPASLKNFNVYTFLSKDYWQDIGTIRAFFEANLSLCQPHPPFQLFHPSRPIYTRQRHLAGSSIIDSQISNCIINDGCLIKQSVLKNSIIGLRSYINTGAYVEGSLLLGADYYNEEGTPKKKRIGIGPNSKIVNAIIDKNAHIGSNVIIENKKKLKDYDDPEERFYIRDGIVVIVKNAYIPDNMVI